MGSRPCDKGGIMSRRSVLAQLRHTARHAVGSLSLTRSVSFAVERW